MKSVENLFPKKIPVQRSRFKLPAEQEPFRSADSLSSAGNSFGGRPRKTSVLQVFKMDYGLLPAPYTYRAGTNKTNTVIVVAVIRVVVVPRATAKNAVRPRRATRCPIFFRSSPFFTFILYQTLKERKV